MYLSTGTCTTAPAYFLLTVLVAGLAILAVCSLIVCCCRSDVASVMKAAVKQLKEKSVRTKQGVFAALQELVTVASDSIGAHTAQIMPGIQAALNVSATQLCSSETVLC